jgi:hypothetical protein
VIVGRVTFSGAAVCKAIGCGDDHIWPDNCAIAKRDEVFVAMNGAEPGELFVVVGRFIGKVT